MKCCVCGVILIDASVQSLPSGDPICTYCVGWTASVVNALVPMHINAGVILLRVLHG